jgi:hypothetical protein
MGVILAVGRLGSVINDNISALLPIQSAYWAAAGMCGFSTLCAWAAVWLDAKYTNGRQRQRDKETASVELELQALTKGLSRGPSPGVWGSLRKRCSDVYKALQQFDVCIKPHAQPRQIDNVYFDYFLQKRFWVLGVVCITGFTSVSSFNNVAGNLLKRRWTAQGVDAYQHKVNFTFSLVYLVSALLASPAGMVVDYTRRRAVFTALSSCIVVCCHLALEHTDVSALAVMIALGVGFSLYAASFWPSVAYIVPKEYYGIAYGVVGCIQNTGLATVPLIVGVLQPPACSNDYVCVLHLFAGLASTALLCSMLLAVAEERAAADSPVRGCVGISSTGQLVAFRKTGKALLAGADGASYADEGSWRAENRTRSGAFSEDDRTHLSTAASCSVLREVGELLHHASASSMALALACESWEVAERRILSSGLTRQDSLVSGALLHWGAANMHVHPAGGTASQLRTNLSAREDVDGGASHHDQGGLDTNPRTVSTSSATRLPLELTTGGTSNLAIPGGLGFLQAPP